MLSEGVFILALDVFFHLGYSRKVTMVMIRLSRIGKKNHPTYRIVVSDKQKDMCAPYLEALGTYDPHTQPSTFVVDKDRLLQWMKNGAQLSDTVHNLCIVNKVIEGEKRNMMHKKVKKEGEETTTTPKPETPPATQEKPKEEVAAKPETPETEKKEAAS